MSRVAAWNLTTVAVIEKLRVREFWPKNLPFN
jgi:hypothetical protein